MPRKPFKPIADRTPGGMIDIGTRGISQRLELFALVGRCIVSWPFIEAEMALALGALLGADNAAALAVFQTLRRSSAQRDAISEAARASRDEKDQELITAVLNVHKSVESERNALAHGHMGSYSLLPNAILWMTTNDYVAFKASIVLAGNTTHTDERRDALNSRLSYYKAEDLETVIDDIDMIGLVWSELIRFLREVAPSRRDQLYRQLCDRSRIAQELVKLRRERTPPAPSE